MLDYDVLSVIREMISNDFGFYLYLSENKLYPKCRKLDFKSLNTNQISQIKFLNYDLIEKYSDLLNWRILTSIHKLDIEFLRRFKHKVDWKEISHTMTFIRINDYQMFREFPHHLDWVLISRWDFICEAFIDEFHDKLDWDILCSSQGLTEFLLQKYSHLLQWKSLRRNQHVPIVLLNKYRPSTRIPPFPLQVDPASIENFIRNHINKKDDP